MADIFLGVLVATCNLVDVVRIGKPMKSELVPTLDGLITSRSYITECEEEPGPEPWHRGGLWLIGDNPVTHGHPTRVEDQRPYGDFSTPGRYAWLLADVVKLDEPIPATGHQGIWNWEGPA
jgi:hypothetical protein